MLAHPGGTRRSCRRCPGLGRPALEPGPRPVLSGPRARAPHLGEGAQQGGGPGHRGARGAVSAPQRRRRPSGPGAGRRPAGRRRPRPDAPDRAARAGLPPARQSVRGPVHRSGWFPGGQVVGARGSGRAWALPGGSSSRPLPWANSSPHRRPRCCCAPTPSPARPGRDRGAPRGGRGSSFGSGRYDHVVDLAERSRLTGVRSNARMARGANVAVPVASVAFPGSPGLGPFSPVRPEQGGSPDGGADRLAGGAGPLGSPV